VTLLVSTILAIPCWPEENPCRPELSEPLRVEALSLVHGIVDADPKTVLRSLDRDGIMIGDNSPTPLAGVKRQFASKTGLFCLFFDTACMGDPSNRSLWSADRALRELSASYRAWLRNAGSPKLEITFEDAPVTKYCGASVAVYHRASVPSRIEFGFVYLDGSWRLSQIGEMP
jgi:hypothetical protein